MMRQILVVGVLVLSFAGCGDKAEISSGEKQASANDWKDRTTALLEADIERPKRERVAQMLSASMNDSQCADFLVAARDADKATPVESAGDAEASCLKTLYAQGLDVFNDELRAAWIAKVLEAQRSGKVDAVVAEHAKREAGLQRLMTPPMQASPSMPIQVAPPKPAPEAPVENKKYQSI